MQIQHDLRQLIDGLKHGNRFIAQNSKGYCMLFRVTRKYGNRLDCQVVNNTVRATFIEGFSAKLDLMIVYVRAGVGCPYTGNDYVNGMLAFERAMRTGCVPTLLQYPKLSPTYDQKLEMLDQHMVDQSLELREAWQTVRKSLTR